MKDLNLANGLRVAPQGTRTRNSAGFLGERSAGSNAKRRAGPPSGPRAELARVLTRGIQEALEAEDLEAARVAWEALGRLLGR